MLNSIMHEKGLYYDRSLITRFLQNISIQSDYRQIKKEKLDSVFFFQDEFTLIIVLSKK